MNYKKIPRAFLADADVIFSVFNEPMKLIPLHLICLNRGFVKRATQKLPMFVWSTKFLIYQNYLFSFR